MIQSSLSSESVAPIVRPSQQQLAKHTELPLEILWEQPKEPLLVDLLALTTAPLLDLDWEPMSTEEESAKETEAWPKNVTEWINIIAPPSLGSRT